MDAKLADRGINRGHFGGLKDRDLYGFFRGQNVELARIKHQFASARLQRLPKVARIMAADIVQIDNAGMATGPIAGQITGQIDPDAAGLKMGRLTLFEPKLVQARAGTHEDRKGLGRDFNIERAIIAAGHIVKGAAVIGQEAHKDINASGRALRIAARGKAR